MGMGAPLAGNVAVCQLEQGYIECIWELHAEAMLAGDAARGDETSRWAGYLATLVTVLAWDACCPGLRARGSSKT